jgi:hypothetical protein
MKEIVLFYSSLTDKCKDLIDDEDFVDMLNDLRKYLTVKIVRVNNDKISDMLLKAHRNRIPFAMIDTGEDHQKIEGVSNIKKTFSDIKAHFEKTQPPDDYIEHVEENIYFVSCKNYPKLSKALLSEFVVLIHDACKISNQTLTSEKISEKLRNRTDRKYLIVTNDSKTISKLMKNVGTTLEQLAKEYKDAHHTFLTKTVAPQPL